MSRPGPAPVLLVCLLTTPAHGAFRASFWLPELAWEATDIVVVRDTPVLDGRVTVLEVWHGDLVPRAELVLPELAAFASEGARRIEKGWSEHPLDAVHVTGDRIVLFLRRGEKIQPAAPSGGLRVSAAWLEEDRAFGFVQTINPGPVRLVNLEEAGSLRERVRKIANQRRAFDGLAGPTGPADPVDRARALVPFMTLPYARKDAYERTGALGPDVVPFLRAMLDDPGPELVPFRWVDAMVEAAGPAAGDELLALLRRITAAWNALPPDEPPALRGAPIEDTSLPISALRALRGRCHEGCIEAVQELRSAWRNLAEERRSLHGTGLIDESEDLIAPLGSPMGSTAEGS